MKALCATNDASFFRRHGTLKQKASSKRACVSNTECIRQMENKVLRTSLVEEEFFSHSCVARRCSNVKNSLDKQQVNQGEKFERVLRKHKKAAFGDKEGQATFPDAVHVIVSSTSSMLVIPRQYIIHMPGGTDDLYPSKALQRLILCDFFDPNLPGSCRAGATCRFVHAITDFAEQREVHYRGHYWEPADCPYPRLNAQAGAVYTVLPPTATRDEVDADEVPAELILKTRCVFDDPKRPACHCAHFFYRRECHLGPLCDFAHVLRLAGAHQQPWRYLCNSQHDFSPTSTHDHFPMESGGEVSVFESPLIDDEIAIPADTSTSTNAESTSHVCSCCLDADQNSSCDHQQLFNADSNSNYYHRMHPYSCHAYGSSESAFAGFGNLYHVWNDGVADGKISFCNSSAESSAQSVCCVVRLSCGNNGEYWRYEPYYYPVLAQKTALSLQL